MKSMKSTVKRTNEEEVFKLLSEQAPVGVCIVQDGKFCHFNSNFPIAIGYTADELVGKDPLELIVPEDREMVRENEIKMLKGELLSPYQFRVIHKDGSIRWVMEAVRSVQYHGRRAVLGNYMEVTERRQMEEALKENEERYKELANSITNVFFAMDEHLRYTYWNKASEILTGIRADDAIGKSFREIFPDTPEVRKAEKVYREVLRTGQPQTFVNDFNINSRHCIFEISTYPSRGGISVFVRDITEPKQAEERLKESEQKYRTILEEMGDGYFETDLAGNITSVNDALIRILGYSKEEIIGMNFRAIRPKEQVKAVFEAYNRMYKTGEPLRNLFTEIICKDGRHIFAETSAFPIRNDKGEIIGFRGVRRDITERKQAEEALRKSEERYRTLAENAHEAIFVVQDGVIKFINPKGAELSGYSIEELVSTPFVKFIYPDDIDMVADRYLKRLRGELVPQTYDFRITRKDGDIRWGELNAVTISWEDRSAVLCFMSDITERKQAQESLRESEERYRALFDRSLDCVYVHDFEGNFLDANETALKLLGYEREDILHLNFASLLSQDQLPKAIATLQELKDIGTQKRVNQFRLKCKGGSFVDVEVMASVIYRDGKPYAIQGIGGDVTERKQMEEKLKESEERYRTILEEMEDSYFEVDLGGHLTFVNNSVCRDLGYSREELIGMSYKGFTIEEDIESVFRVFNEVYRTGAPNKGSPWKTIRKDGSHGFAETSISLLRNDKGEIIGFRGVGRDITERKQAEEKLRQSEENYKTLFNSSVIGMYVLDVETMKVVMGNRAVAEMAGFGSAGEGIGINPLDFVIPEDREQVLEMATKEFEQDLRRTHELRVVAKNGGTGWISITSARIMHNGRLAALVSINNITKRKRMEEAVRQSEENYRALFDSTVIGTFVIDAETMEVVIGNQAAAKIFGLASTEEAIGMNPLDFILPEDRERVLGIVVKELFEQDLRRTHELQAITKDGREIWVSITGARIMHGGRLAGLVSFTDITEQKRQSERLMMTDRLASLGELASGAAHELNNPLTSIIGFSQLLMEREVPDDIREDLKLINNEAQRAVSVTKNLLTFARKHAPVKQRDQINNIIEDVLKLRTYEHKTNSIEVERQLDQNLPKIMVDYFQMQQVFVNIIINAEYFMTKAHNKGTLTITTKKQGNTVMISFADDGPGIPPENMERLFDPFFTTKEVGKGTGLGLSICHGIVTEHGGQIYIRSQLGKGATVFVELPINGHDHIGDMFKTD